MQPVRPILDEAGLERLERLALLGEMEEPCPYLPGRSARFKFLDGRFAGIFFRDLMDFGYRRNGQFIYRPTCTNCRECSVLRVPIATFQKTKEQRRIWNRGNQVFTLAIARPEYTEEKALLYLKYLREVHGNERDTLESTHYRQFLLHTCLDDQTYEFQLRHEGRLVGLGIIDVFDDALSSVYFFYDPEYRRYSPGTYSVLAELAFAARMKLAYYYPGYYIPACPAMNYKVRFRPREVRELDEGHWGEPRPREAGPQEKIVDNSPEEW